MESNNVQSHDQDRFSQLTDDILLSILERVNMRTVIRASILSTRWRHLPLMLSHINLEVDDLICPDSTMVNKETSSHEAMSVLIKMLSSLLGSPERECTIRNLTVSFCLLTDMMASIRNLNEIKKLVCNAIDSGKVKNVEFEIASEKSVVDCTDAEMIEHAVTLVDFFDNSTSLLCCLTQLTLFSARFSEQHLNQVINSCNQLQRLCLACCGTWDSSLLTLDIPTSKLLHLELYSCKFNVKFLSLPKLEQLQCESWYCLDAPFSFGLVPRLEELHLVCAALHYQPGFKLSDLLRGTANLQALTLDFQGEKIWITPEGKELCPLLNKVTKLFLHDIYVEFDLLWTLVFLQAAPSIKIFGIKVRDHACDEDPNRRKLYGERTHDLWNGGELNGSIHYLQLEKLHFGGFKPIKEHLDFIRAVMQRSPNLKAIVLEKKEPCEECETLDIPVDPLMSSMFPKNKDEESIVAKQLKAGLSHPIQIMFC